MSKKSRHLSKTCLLMFNIHALREQWDLLTVALKLPKIIDLLTKEAGKAPTEREISEKTGLEPCGDPSMQAPHGAYRNNTKIKY